MLEWLNSVEVPASHFHPGHPRLDPGTHLDLPQAAGHVAVAGANLSGDIFRDAAPALAEGRARMERRATRSAVQGSGIRRAGGEEEYRCGAGECCHPSPIDVARSPTPSAR